VFISRPAAKAPTMRGTRVRTRRQYNRFWLSTKNAGFRVARFCQIAPRAPEQHRDALAFPDGNTVLVNLLSEGQHARVIQLPVIKQEHGVSAEKGFDDCGRA
jgi:hypothetical protein